VELLLGRRTFVPSTTGVFEVDHDERQKRRIVS